MIEKLEPIKAFNCSDTPQAKMQHHSYHNDCISKINELVDAVNRHENIIRQIGEWGSGKGECLWCDTLTEFNPKKPTISKMEKVDPYAEQRKWIGCICRFWYDNPNNTLLDYLDKIRTGKNGVEYYAKESGDWFSHCKPVLPTDNAIYKGGDNE